MTVALSSGSASLLASVPVPISGNAITLRDIVTLVQRVMNVGIVIATLAIVAMIVYAGFKMATSRGQEKDYEAAKQTLKYAIYGALVVFGVGLIVNTIANVAYDPTRVLY
jgi:TRAP-type C4-dicarboxylate transport system permease small subunit